MRRHARAGMDFRADGGRILGINPTTLVVPPSLEDAALTLFEYRDQRRRWIEPLEGHGGSDRHPVREVI